MTHLKDPVREAVNDANLLMQVTSAVQAAGNCLEPLSKEPI